MRLSLGPIGPVFAEPVERAVILSRAECDTLRRAAEILRRIADTGSIEVQS